MKGEIKKYLKITVYTLLTLSILVFLSGILVFSHPFFLNMHVNLLIKYSGTDPHEFKFQTCTKEEFALKYLNISITQDDDFVEIFEGHYGTSSKKDNFLIITYDIQDLEDNSTYTLYGINRYTDFVYISTRKVHQVDEKRSGAFNRDIKSAADGQEVSNQNEP